MKILSQDVHLKELTNKSPQQFQPSCPLWNIMALGLSAPPEVTVSPARWDGGQVLRAGPPSPNGDLLAHSAFPSRVLREEELSATTASIEQAGGD